MIDFHTHILPNVDDGSSKLEESLDMIKHEISEGVKEIYLTPHHILGKYEASSELIKRKYEELVNEVNKNNLDIKLHLGEEIHYSTRENIASLLKEGKLFCLGDSNVILLEFDYELEPREDICEIIYNFSIKGYRVMLAHVERYSWLNFETIVDAKNEGAIIQVNANSILGINVTNTSKKIIKKLLKYDLIDVISSDTHFFRPSNMQKAYNKLKDDRLFNYNLK